MTLMQIDERWLNHISIKTREVQHAHALWKRSTENESVVTFHPTLEVSFYPQIRYFYYNVNKLKRKEPKKNGSKLSTEFSNN